MGWADEHNLNRLKGTDDLATDHRFTGHPSTLLRNRKADGTGLMYYNARYYDPEIGQFISPDSIVPDPTNVFAYNRYMYVYGNPLKYHDSSGNVPEISVGGDSGGLSIYSTLESCLGSLTCERTMIGRWLQEHPSYTIENDPLYGQHTGYGSVLRALSQMALDDDNKELALLYWNKILSQEGWIDMAIIDGSFAAMGGGVVAFGFKGLYGKSIKWIKRNKPRGWKTEPTNNRGGWKWIDENGQERLRYYRPSGNNPSQDRWARQSNGYLRWQDADGNYLDIDGNVVPTTDPDFQWKTHIPYEGIP